MDRKVAQANLDFHPDASPFWDGPLGQETLELAKELGLRVTTTNRERIERHACALRNVALDERRQRLA